MFSYQRPITRFMHAFFYVLFSDKDQFYLRRYEVKRTQRAEISDLGSATPL